jgi:hypothetical protein
MHDDPARLRPAVAKPSNERRRRAVRDFGRYLGAPPAAFVAFVAFVACSSSGALGDANGGPNGGDSGGAGPESSDDDAALSSPGPGASDGSALHGTDAGSGGSTGSDGGKEASTPGDGSTIDAPPGAGDGGASDILVPAQGALLGHFYGNGALAATDALIGRKPRLHLNYYDWVTDWSTDSTLTADFADGRVPIVNWEPYDAKGNMIDFAGILSGSFDAQINERAAGAKALGQKFFLDFAAEMNSDEDWTKHDAAQYISAWRHIHDLFVAAGATNVIWAWCPNVTDSDDTNDATMSYYPGDAYVDWTGVDGYNWGTSDPSFVWQSFQDVFKDIYPLLAKVGKPILIGEMASDEVGGSKAQWIDDLVPTLKADFPLIKAFVWFDIKKERAWQINSSPTALASYSKMALDPFMNP